MALIRILPIFIIGFVLVVSLVHMTEATYRKPPFNGSIFGKRNSIDYDPSGKALSAMCEIALESCQSWFPQEKK